KASEKERTRTWNRSSTMAKCLLRRGGLVLLKTSACCGLPIFLKANHQLESRVPEIGLLGSEGGATSSVVPTPIIAGGAARSDDSKVHTNDSTLTRNKSLLVSPFSEGC